MEAAGELSEQRQQAWMQSIWDQHKKDHPEMWSTDDAATVDRRLSRTDESRPGRLVGDD
jgi:hypothetical protein